MLRTCHGAQSAPPGMATKCLRLSDVDSLQTPFNLMTSIETFLDDTSAMELDGSFLTYSDMDFSSDGSDLREKQHQMALNTTFLSPIDHGGISKKFESTQFLPFDPEFSVISQDVSTNILGSPLSISSWDLDSQSDDVVAPPNSPNTTDANESTRRQLIVKAMQNYVATNRVADNVVPRIEPSCSLVNCGCTDSERSASMNDHQIDRKIADYANETCYNVDVARLGERPPCDGMESPRETLLQAHKALPVATGRQPVCSDGNISSVMNRKKQNPSDVKARKTSGKCIKDERKLLSRPVVKCSVLSMPSNDNSADDMRRTSRYGTATGCCRKPNSNGDVCALRRPSEQTLEPAVSSRTMSNNLRKNPPCYIPAPSNDMNPANTHLTTLSDNGTTLSVSTLSCSINSDATCFMKRPLCRGGVTNRGQHVSQARHAILSKKLKQIGRYLHRSSGARRTRLIPELQTLGIV